MKKNNKKVQWTFLCSSPKTGKREGASGPFYVRARKQESEKVPVDLFMFEPENRKAKKNIKNFSYNIKKRSVEHMTAFLIWKI